VSEENVAAYLERLGFAERPKPTLESLARLQLAHVLAIPFENLDIAAGTPISLELEAIFEKVVRRRRGGFCYELNGLFAWLLEELGFQVTLLQGRTVNGVHGELGPMFDHLVLRVDLDEPWLSDVGWGETSRAPLPLRHGAEHTDALIGTYRLRRRGPDWDILERVEPEADARDVVPCLEPGATWRTQYRFDLEARALADFAQTCRWQETESPFFTRHRFCTLATPDGRRTLMDDRLIVRFAGARVEETVADADVPDLLQRLFGISMS
jgi:N-hydroxyarylamine O-acetyltransferase